MFNLQESPKYLVARGRDEEAIKVNYRFVGFSESTYLSHVGFTPHRKSEQQGDDFDPRTPPASV